MQRITSSRVAAEVINYLAVTTIGPLDLTQDGGKVGTGASVANAAAIAVPLFLIGHNLVKQQQIKKSSNGKFKYKCLPPSMLIYGGASTLMIGALIKF